MTRKQVFRIFKLIFINLAVIFLFLIILDPIIGMIVKEKEGSVREINFKENKPLSILKIQPFKSDKNHEEVLKRTDKYGFILGPDQKSEDDIDIIFLGASNVESENVREAKRFPYLSVKLLNEKSGNHFISRNAGVGGNLLSTSNIILTSKIIDIHPEYVVLSSSLIDLLYLSKNESYWSGPKKYLITSTPRSRFLKGIKDYLFPNIWLQVRKFIVSANNSDFTESKFSPREKERILGQYEKQLTIFITTCQVYGIKPILATDYYLSEVVQKSLQERNIFNSTEAEYYVHNLIPQLNELITQKAEEFSVPVIKLNELVEKKNDYVSDENGIHLTNEGSEKVSEVMANYLAREIDHEEI